MGEVEVDEEEVEGQNVAILDWDTQYFRISISQRVVGIEWKFN